VESRRPESRLQSDVGNGAIAEHPVTQMPAAAVSGKSCAVFAATVSAATVSAATAARVCFKCEKRHDEEQHRGQASAGRQHQPHGAAGLGAPHRCGRLSLGILPRTKSF
jgi:hypothetical protein